MKVIRNTGRIGRRQARTAMLFLAPSLLGVIAFVLLPFGDAVRRSFFDAMGRNFVGLSNYDTVFDNEIFKLASFNTLRFAGVCVPLLIIASLILALLIRSSRYGKETFKSAFLLPMAIPVASVVLLWKALFSPGGLINGLLGQQIEWMNSDSAFYVLVGSYIWKNAGYDMILWLAGLSGISPSLYEAARVDGAGSWQCFWRITLPNMLPTLYIIAVLSFLNSFKVFREAYLVAGNYPHDSIFLLQHLFNNWFAALDIQKLCAAAVVVAIVIFLLILVLQKLWGDDDG